MARASGTVVIVALTVASGLLRVLLWGMAFPHHRLRSFLLHTLLLVICRGAGAIVGAETILGEDAMHSPSRLVNFGAPWIALCAAFALHITDEALTGFLKIYNPTVAVLRERWAWFPMPQFEFRGWLVGLIIACAILCCLTPFAYAGSRGLRPLAWVFAVIMLLNGIGHTVFTIMGRTVESVTFARPAPGFYSSPALLAASLWMIVRLRSAR